MGRQVLAIVLLVGTGCRQLLGFDNPGALGDAASPTDSDVPVGDVSSELMPVDGCTTFSTVVDTCATTAQGPVAITGSATYNTQTFVLDIGGVTSTPQHVVFTTPTGEIDALFATTFTLTGVLRVTGSRPFAIIATDRITIAGTGEIDVSTGGAGARVAMACSTEVGVAGVSDIGGGSGGGGAGYQAGGGNGGNGDSDNGQSQGGNGGGSRLKPTAPLGGCPGGRGGQGIGQGGAGGAGGGAMLLASAVGTIMNGVLIAGGGGGLGGIAPTSGGGGGGSGGMIVIEGMVSIADSATVTANGGGGGEGGGGTSNGSSGSPGNKVGSQAAGGAGGSATGADGASGSGSGQNFGSSPSTVQIDGGGGGGGAAGFIAIGSASAIVDGTVSPTPVGWP